MLIHIVPHCTCTCEMEMASAGIGKWKRTVLTIFK